MPLCRAAFRGLWGERFMGWIILGLFVLAWVAVYLIWNGLRLLGGL